MPLPQSTEPAQHGEISDLSLPSQLELLGAQQNREDRELIERDLLMEERELAADRRDDLLHDREVALEERERRVEQGERDLRESRRRPERS